MIATPPSTYHDHVLNFNVAFTHPFTSRSNGNLHSLQRPFQRPRSPRLHLGLHHNVNLDFETNRCNSILKRPQHHRASFQPQVQRNVPSTCHLQFPTHEYQSGESPGAYEISMPLLCRGRGRSKETFRGRKLPRTASHDDFVTFSTWRRIHGRSP